MINKLLEQIKNQEVNITNWILGFSGIIFVRLILEGLSSPTLYGTINTDWYSIIHVGLYFLAVTLAAILVFGIFTKNYTYASKIVLFGLPLIWLAPLLDILVSKGRGLRMLYVFDSGKNLVFDFFTFFGPKISSGATIGIRFGIALALIGIIYLIWKEIKDLKKSIFAGILIYSFVFLMAVMPGFIYTIANPGNPPAESIEIISYIEKIVSESTISHNSFREGAFSVTRERFIEVIFSNFLSQIFFILSLMISGLILWKIDRKKFSSVMRNIRLERVNFYTLSLFCGIGFAYINKMGNHFVFSDIPGFICITVAWISLWMHAVHLNDINDLEIDKISNKERPLVKNDLTLEEMMDIGNLWLLVGLVGAFLSGFYPFFMALVYIACSHIYSAPPLRLRRFPVVPSFLIGVACLGTILAGFFFISENKEIKVFPPFLAVGIVIMVTLAINFKDIKDVEGDKKNGIMTIPVLFPENGTKIVAFLFSLGILLIPIFLSFHLLYIIIIPAAILGYKIINKKPYIEKHVFTLRFFLVGAISISYLIIYWLANVYNIL